MSASAVVTLAIGLTIALLQTVSRHMNAAGALSQPLSSVSSAAMRLPPFAMWPMHPPLSMSPDNHGILRKTLTLSMEPNNLTLNTRPRETGKGRQHSRKFDGPHI